MSMGGRESSRKKTLWFVSRAFHFRRRQRWTFMLVLREVNANEKWYSRSVTFISLFYLLSPRFTPPFHQANLFCFILRLWWQEEPPPEHGKLRQMSFSHNFKRIFARVEVAFDVCHALVSTTPPLRFSSSHSQSTLLEFVSLIWLWQKTGEEEDCGVKNKSLCGESMYTASAPTLFCFASV